MLSIMERFGYTLAQLRAEDSELLRMLAIEREVRALDGRGEDQGYGG